MDKWEFPRFRILQQSLQEDNGNYSAMRLMSFIALFAAIFFAHKIFTKSPNQEVIDIIKAPQELAPDKIQLLNKMIDAENQQGGSEEWWIFLGFLSAAFGGKIFQKMAESKTNVPAEEESAMTPKPNLTDGMNNNFTSHSPDNQRQFAMTPNPNLTDGMNNNFTSNSPDNQRQFAMTQNPNFPERMNNNFTSNSPENQGQFAMTQNPNLTDGMNNNFTSHSSENNGDNSPSIIDSGNDYFARLAQQNGVAESLSEPNLSKQ